MPFKFSSFKIFLYLLNSTYIVFFLSGCVTALESRVPGTEYGGGYCIASKYSKEFNETVKEASYIYGNFRKYPIGGNRSRCSFSDFHVLNVSWETTKGIQRKEIIDIRPLIKRLRSGRKIPMAFGYPDLVIELNDEKLSLSYELYTNNPDIDYKKRFLVYELLTTQ